MFIFLLKNNTNKIKFKFIQNLNSKLFNILSKRTKIIKINLKLVTKSHANREKQMNIV